MTNTTASITAPSTHFLHSTVGGRHVAVAFIKHWEGVSIWSTETFASREEVMRLLTPKIDTGYWTPMKACSLEEGRTAYANLLKGGYKPVKP